MVTREEIPSGLRGPDHVAGSNAVDQQIRSLRARVQDDRRRPRSIAAGPGRRFRFLPTSRENGTAAASLRRADRRIHVPRRRRIDGIPSGGTTMARTLTCDCGEVLTGQDDEELFRQGRQHIKEDHPNLVMSDGQIRDLITAKAKDA